MRVFRRWWRRWLGPRDYFRRETLRVNGRRLTVRELSCFEKDLMTAYINEHTDAPQTAMFAYTASLCCEELHNRSVDDIRAEMSEVSLMTIQAAIMRLSGYMAAEPDDDSAAELDDDTDADAEQKKSGRPTVGFSTA